MNKVKSVVTTGPMSKDEETIKKLILNGADAIRINMKYASHEFAREVIKKVREVNHELGTGIGIMMEINGPTIKCGRFIGGSAYFATDDKIRLYMNDMLGDNTKVSVDYPELINDIEKDTIIKLNDGLVELKVFDKGNDYIICNVLNGGNVTDYSSVNVIDTYINIPFLGVNDIKDIEFANEMNIDFISLPYVKSSEDVLQVTDMLIGLKNDHMDVIAKLECSSAIDDIDNIIKMSDGIIIDRGNLSIQLPMERVPGIQKIIINKCRRMGKVSLVATDMLTSMEITSRPTRAEVSDIANAVLDGVDGIVLTDETTIGKHPIETIKTLESIVKEVETDIDYESLYEEASREENADITGMIAANVTSTANRLKCKAIITPTVSGYTARKISRFRPSCPIIAVSPELETVTSLSLHFGINAYLIDELNSLDRIIKVSEKLTRELIPIESNDKIIITGGYPFKETKNTNFMKIEEL